MIKFLCDICKKEILSDFIPCELIIRDRIYAFSKKGLDLKNLKAGMQITTWVICNTCREKIINYAKKLQMDTQKGTGESNK